MLTRTNSPCFQTSSQDAPDARETKNQNRLQIPISEKFLLTIKEASAYFNIGENKLYRIANDYLDSDFKFVIQNGGRTMINRKKFEDFLNNSTSI